MNLVLNIYKYIKPYKSIIWFLILFVFFDFLWKICVHVGSEERVFIVFGNDLTSNVEGLCQWTADAVYWVVNKLWGYNDFKIDGSTLYFDNSLPVEIVWGCTGIKQLFMFSFIMLLFFGPVKKKLWFIPLSLFILAVVNILRLAIIFIIIKNPYPEWFISINEWYNDKVWVNTKACYWDFYVDWFNVFHRDIFTWLYYDGVMLILWLFWEERFNKPYQTLRQSLSKKD